MGVTIKGIGSLQAKLSKLDPLTRAAVSRGVHKAGLKVEGDAKLLAPVGKVMGGTLRDSINTNHKTTSTGAEASVGTNVAYAARIEFGFMNKRDRLGRLYFQPAQPYLQPALQKNKKNATKIVMTEIRKAFKGI